MSDALKTLTEWCDRNTNTLAPIAMGKDIILTLAEAGLVIVPRKNLRVLSRRVANGRSLPDFFLRSGKNRGGSE